MPDYSAPAPNTNPQQNQPSSITDEVLRGSGMTAAQFQALVAARQRGTSSTEYNPFAFDNNGEAGILWLGSKNDPSWSTMPGLPGQKPAGMKKSRVNYRGYQIDVLTPDYGDGFKVEIHTSWGHNPSEKELKEARANPNSVRIFAQVRDPNGKVVDSVSLDDGQTRTILGLNFDPTSPGPKGKVLSAESSTPLQVTMDPYAREKTAQGMGATIVGGRPQTDSTGTIQGEMEKLFKMNPKQLRALKTQLWLAGYYGDSVTLDQVSMSTITNEDISAFGGIMVEAARYWSAGQKVTWQELLGKQAADPSSKHKRPQEPIIPLTDPEAIAKAANETGTKVLGRAPTAKDVSSIVAMIHKNELTYGKAQNAGGGQGEVQHDPQADMEAYMRQKYPNEAMAVDWGSAAQQWDALLTQSSPQPPIVGTPGA